MVLGSTAGVGAGVDLQDAEQVKEYLNNLGIEYRFGCYHEKNPKSCHLLGDYLESVKKDFAKAFKVYQINCEEYEHGHSCHKAAGYKYIGKACAKSADESYNLFRKGCDLGHASACLNAGILDAANKSSKGYERSLDPDPVMASHLYKKACEGDIAEGCHRYAALFINGVQGFLQKNMEEAFTYSLKACELGSMGGCVNVSTMYRKGEGVEKNPVAAKEYGNIAQEMMKQLREEQNLNMSQGAEGS